jgi:hypothetical protein
LTARALAVNVTVVAPPAYGHIQLYPAGSQVPATSVLNFGPGKTRANNAVLSLGVSGSVNARSTLLGEEDVHLLIDVVGYFE